ncbi:nucleotidyl transferase AbiEii/AbiGii toxin family protein, partial [Acidobacteriota bacterium]
MLDIKQIEPFYPENLRPFKRNLLREYVQVKILETLFESDWSQKLVFMGGTAIHLFHGNTRFSEGLDFDNLGLDKSHFGLLISAVLTSLRRHGFNVENRNVFRTAFRSYLKFSDLLYKYKISRHRHEKLNIQ